MIPLVSVIIPCYNGAAFVQEAIQSALNQTYKNIEVIVVDDGSTDESREVISSFGSDVRMISIENSGACKARNVGFTASRGEFIQFLDADDIILNDKVEKQAHFLITGQADLVFSNGILFYEDGREEIIKNIANIRLPAEIDPFLFFLGDGIGTNGPLHRRSFVEKVKGFTPGLSSGQETDFHMRLGIFNPRLLKLDDITFHVRHFNNPNRLTKRPKEAGILLKILLNVYTTYVHSGFRNDLRNEKLGARLFQSSIYAFRNGAEELAAQGFKAAKSLTSNADYKERDWYKFAARRINPLTLERVLKIFRKVKYSGAAHKNGVSK